MNVKTQQLSFEDERARTILELARKQWQEDGEVEFDDADAKVSEGTDNGCYVLAWVWVDFAGTDLDKEP